MIPSLKTISGEATLDERPIPDRVLASAVRLFTKKGYFNTTMPDLSRDAGVSIGAIYHHFKDKEDVARTLYNNSIEIMDNIFNQIEITNSMAEDRCKNIIMILLKLAEDEPDTMQYMMYVKHEEFSGGSLTICSAKPFLRMRHMVAEGIKNGEIRKMETIVATSTIFGPTMRMMVHRFDGLLSRPLPTYYSELWDAAWKAVRPEAT